jgi:hypothetical protein
MTGSKSPNIIFYKTSYISFITIPANEFWFYLGSCSFSLAIGPSHCAHFGVGVRLGTGQCQPPAVGGKCAKRQRASTSGPFRWMAPSIFDTQSRCPRALARWHNIIFFLRALHSINPPVACCCCGFLGEDELFIDCNAHSAVRPGTSQRRNYILYLTRLSGHITSVWKEIGRKKADMRMLWSQPESQGFERLKNLFRSNCFFSERWSQRRVRVLWVERVASLKGFQLPVCFTLRSAAEWDEWREKKERKHACKPAQKVIDCSCERICFLLAKKE